MCLQQPLVRQLVDEGCLFVVKDNAYVVDVIYQIGGLLSSILLRNCVKAGKYSVRIF